MKERVHAEICPIIWVLRGSRYSNDSFVFGQDDPSILLPSASQVVKDDDVVATPRNYQINENSSSNQVVGEQIETQIYVSQGEVEEMGSISSDKLKVDDDAMEYVYSRARRFSKANCS